MASNSNVSNETELANGELEDDAPFKKPPSTATEQEDLPLTVYSPQAAVREPVKLFGDIADGFIKGRELAWRLFVRNLSGMYRQTLWVVLGVPATNRQHCDLDFSQVSECFLDG